MVDSRFVHYHGKKGKAPAPSKRDKITHALAQQKGGGVSARKKKQKVTLAGAKNEEPRRHSTDPVDNRNVPAHDLRRGSRYSNR